MKSLAKLCIGVLLATGAASADCEIRNSTLDNFGANALGAIYLSVPAGATRDKNCVVEPAKQYMDCEFTDTGSIAYLIDGKTLVRKEIRAGRRPIRLPFGIQSTDSMLSIVKTFGAMKNAPDLYVRYVDGTYTVNTGLCLRNAQGNVFDLYYTFDESGRLKAFGDRIESESN